jgi:integrase
MAIHKLSPAFVEKVTSKGVYSDGLGLYLRVQGNTKSWVFRFARSRFGGKGETEMGLGSTHITSLHDARELARQFSGQLRDGIDPLVARKAADQARKLEKSKDKTLGFCAEEWFVYKIKKSDWHEKTHKAAKRHFEKYVYPELKNVSIQQIDHLRLEQVLSPLSQSHPATYSHVWMYLEAIFNHATAKNYRSGDNPASKKGPLGVLLPRPSSHVAENHPSLPYQEISALMDQLANTTAIKTAARMAILQLQFIILTAVRIDQVHKMRWDEIKEEGDDRVWVCPAVRTKRVGRKPRRDHLVPLSTAAWAILTEMRNLQKRSGLHLEFVFVRALPLPDRQVYYDKTRQIRQRELANVPLQRNAASMWLARSGIRKGYSVPDFKVHGFRTTFSTWANEMGGFEHRDIETALHHIVTSTGGDSSVPVSGVSRIYNKAERLPQRRELLEAWGKYCGRSADVIPFRQAK